jgi:16S rRNA (uracil1498-N3)-methyltransferase
VVELRDRAAVATFFAGEPMQAGRISTLTESEAHHARVLRVSLGDRVRLVDGAGSVGLGQIVKVAKGATMIAVDSVDRIEPLPVVHLMLPIADRERMLWLAEKATELGVFSWRPVMWRRSRNVTPRGEGIGFQSRVRARMVAALTQSGGAWLPVLYPDATPERALAASPAGARWLLDAHGEPAPSHGLQAPITIALGPEGGLEAGERAEMLAAGFTAVRLAPLTLRFETAAIAALGIVRAALSAQREKVRG